jgi:hypothetical protein
MDKEQVEAQSVDNEPTQEARVEEGAGNQESVNRQRFDPNPKDKSLHIDSRPNNLSQELIDSGR